MPLSDVPLARAISVPGDGSISLSTGSCQIQTQRASSNGAAMRVPGKDRVPNQEEKDFHSFHRDHSQTSAGSETFHHHHEGNYGQCLSGRCQLEPGDVRGLGCLRVGAAWSEWEGARLSRSHSAGQELGETGSHPAQGCPNQRALSCSGSGTGTGSTCIPTGAHRA